jgi:hypothetical protein
MAATNKCLTRTNKSRTGANATNKQPAAWRQAGREIEKAMQQEFLLTAMALLAGAALVLAPASADAKTLTQCGTSEGYTYFLPGGLTPARKAGFTADTINDGAITLNLHNDEIDLIVKNAKLGETTSVRQSGAEVIVLPADKGLFNVMTLFKGGQGVEHYLFQLDERGNGSVVYTAVRAGSPLPQVSVMRAWCRGT